MLSLGLGSIIECCIEQDSTASDILVQIQVICSAICFISFRPMFDSLTGI